ncbi:MAG: Molybdopterin synthase catalytic subunit MoaE [uncultured Acidimicrobiales bacterium]|uniref:Molybdopterin synthase catalytic subunit MoaE n=1 Tax=uncultured Acidimicrobiales bacterium TaxID=310071 RepID=A0A6J4IR90_9ACTN|nr:MAG: Molybdopterin synthase catalytic subunit MoaE [uncultured Acidimicrobiales bacterium]
MGAVLAPDNGDDWVALSEEPLPLGAGLEWVTLPSCGGTVLFSGTVRDHADGRTGVTGLHYEAYVEQAEKRMQAVIDDARSRWPDVGRIALLHRIGQLELLDVAVIVVASAPHRDVAFEAARFCIDTLKATVPIWKKETWEGGSDWGTRAQSIEAPGEPGLATA